LRASCSTKINGIRGCSRTAGCAPPCRSRTYIAFDELPDENWAIAGKLLDED
jgi:phenylpyruvate tautomerase PptA (4-oxalocrotonate tautomerase family)